VRLSALPVFRHLHVRKYTSISHNEIWRKRSKWKIQWHHRESNLRPSGLWRDASNKYVTACPNHEPHLGYILLSISVDTELSCNLCANCFTSIHRILTQIIQRGSQIIRSISFWPWSTNGTLLLCFCLVVVLSSFGHVWDRNYRPGQRFVHNQFPQKIWSRNCPSTSGGRGCSIWKSNGIRGEREKLRKGLPTERKCNTLKTSRVRSKIDLCQSHKNGPALR
jgi:hypothetical protein